MLLLLYINEQLKLGTAWMELKLIGRHSSYVYAHYTTVRNQSDGLI